jgi:hypothetical protein
MGFYHERAIGERFDIFRRSRLGDGPGLTYRVHA